MFQFGDDFGTYFGIAAIVVILIGSFMMGKSKK